MNAVPTNQLRTALADAAAGMLAGCTLSVGSGHYANGAPIPPQPSETTLQTPTITGIPVTVTREGNTIILQGTVTGTDIPTTITEAGVFLLNGTAIILDSFAPKTLQAPMTHTFKFTLFPGGS